MPLDYCLKSYLEVIFLDPRMKIYVQGALVINNCFSSMKEVFISMHEFLMNVNDHVSMKFICFFIEIQ